MSTFWGGRPAATAPGARIPRVGLAVSKRLHMRNASNLADKAQPPDSRGWRVCATFLAKDARKGGGCGGETMAEFPWQSPIPTAQTNLSELRQAAITRRPQQVPDLRQVLGPRPRANERGVRCRPQSKFPSARMRTPYSISYPSAQGQKHHNGASGCEEGKESPVTQ